MRLLVKGEEDFYLDEEEEVDLRYFHYKKI